MGGCSASCGLFSVGLGCVSSLLWVVVVLGGGMGGGCLFLLFLFMFFGADAFFLVWLLVHVWFA